MAEGWARHMYGNAIDVYSAGTIPHEIDPGALRVMAESGVDISGHTFNHVDEYMDIPFDLVVTVCDSARKSCPAFTGEGKIVHHSFDDPPSMVRGAQNEDEALTHYRRVRDEIRDFVVGLTDLL